MKEVSKHKKLDRIGVNKEAYLYLRNLSREQRGCKVLNHEQSERIWNKIKKEDDLAILDDESLGGGEGKYYGRWWSWSCDDMRSFLRDQGFTWKDMEPIEFDCIEVYL